MELNLNLSNYKNFRKAFLVPFMFGLTAMAAVFIFGGSVADKAILKNRYYQIKDFTDKLAIATGSIYQKTTNTTTAEADALTVLSTHPLYTELFNKTIFDWNLNQDRVSVRVIDYDFETYWLRFINLNTIKIDEVNSTVSLEISGGTSPKYASSTGLKPIAINDQNLSIGTTKTFRFDIASLWDYSDKEKFYGLDLYADDDNGHGADHVVMYRNELSEEDNKYTLNVCNDDDLYDDDDDDDNHDCDYEDGEERNVSLLGAYLGNYTSNNSVDVGNTVKGFESFTGYFHGNAPVDYEPKIISVALLGSSEEIVGFMSLSVDSIDYVDTGTPDDRWIEITTTVLGKPKAKLIE